MAAALLLPVRLKVAVRLFFVRTRFWTCGRGDTPPVSQQSTHTHTHTHYMSWHALVMKLCVMPFSLFLQSPPLWFVHISKISMLFDSLFSKHGYTVHDHARALTVTLSSADADSTWLTQVDLSPYAAAPLSQLLSMHYSANTIIVC